MRFHAWMVAHMLNAEVLFFQVKEGIMHELIGDQTLKFNAAMLNMRGGAYWWATAVSIWKPEFVEYMNRLIEDSSPIDELWPWFSTAGP